MTALSMLSYGQFPKSSFVATENGFETLNFFFKAFTIRSCPTT